MWIAVESTFGSLWNARTVLEHKASGAEIRRSGTWNRRVAAAATQRIGSFGFAWGS
jgi:hypothetical protein